MDTLEEMTQDAVEDVGDIIDRAEKLCFAKFAITDDPELTLKVAKLIVENLGLSRIEQRLHSIAIAMELKH